MLKIWQKYRRFILIAAILGVCLCFYNYYREMVILPALEEERQRQIWEQRRQDLKEALDGK